MNKKIALVTGAGQGIGRGIAIELASAGYNLIINDLFYDTSNIEKGLFEVENYLKNMGVDCIAAPGDISEPATYDVIIAAADKMGGLDLLVNNAGIAPRVRYDILDTTMESYDRLMNVNTRGTFFLTQRIAKYMMDHKTDYLKNIIFSTSISAEVSSIARAEYCMSKAALSMAARVFAHRLADEGICVFEVRPGIIATDMTAGVKDKYDKLIAEGLVPQNRWGTPEDIGKAIVGLASGAFGYSTGQIIEIGGGMGIPRL